jgi:hypothetical protein
MNDQTENNECFEFQQVMAIGTRLQLGAHDFWTSASTIRTLRNEFPNIECFQQQIKTKVTKVVEQETLPTLSIEDQKTITAFRVSHMDRSTKGYRMLSSAEKGVVDLSFVVWRSFRKRVTYVINKLKRIMLSIYPPVNGDRDQVWKIIHNMFQSCKIAFMSF